VGLALVNTCQLVALTYIAGQQARSTRERIRRSALDDARHAGRFDAPPDGTEGTPP
jgi:hypothetical protein